MRTLLLSAFAALALHAQLLTNPVQDYINRTTLLNNILSNGRAISMSQSAQLRSVTTYTHSGTSILPSQLAGKAGPQAETYLGSLVSLYEQTARKDGFPPHDLAYAVEYFLVNSYMAYHNLHEVEYSKDPRTKNGTDSFDRLARLAEKRALQVSLSQERAVYEQCKLTLAANPAVRQLTDRHKQEVTELLAIAFGVNLKQYMDAVNRGDDAGIERAREQARSNLEKVTGVPIDRIRFTATGLRQ